MDSDIANIFLSLCGAPALVGGAALAWLFVARGIERRGAVKIVPFYDIVASCALMKNGDVLVRHRRGLALIFIFAGFLMMLAGLGIAAAVVVSLSRGSNWLYAGFILISIVLIVTGVLIVAGSRRSLTVSDIVVETASRTVKRISLWPLQIEKWPFDSFIAVVSQPFEVIAWGEMDTVIKGATISLRRADGGSLRLGQVAEAYAEETVGWFTTALDKALVIEEPVWA
ncbi:MAG: hypothetical protein HY260_22850 [Chloroflexi bacterium]|nr:hypothetical protein [Chloroflexota bacterium]